MTDDRLTQILDAAYVCFTRHGFRRTTMEDIARQAGVSRPTVYQYVDKKEGAFARLTTRILDDALDAARHAADADGPLADRLVAVLATKLDLTLTVWRDSPAHAAEILGSEAHPAGGPVDAYTAALSDLLTTAIRTGLPHLPADEAREVAEVLLALTRGLEADLTDLDNPARRLRHGVTLLVAGLRRPATQEIS